MAEYNKLLKTTIEPVGEYRLLEPMDHLVRKSTNTDGLWHHGLYVGHEKDEGVFHVNNASGPKMQDISKFSCIDALYRIIHTESTRSPSDIKRDVERYQTGEKKWIFNVVTDNCEHFVYLLKTGEQISHQAERYVPDSLAPCAAKMVSCCIDSFDAAEDCRRRGCACLQKCKSVENSIFSSGCCSGADNSPTSEDQNQLI